MRDKKLIAILVAGLFAEGTAWADDNFNWSGNLELGGRATNTDGATRNGARGTSATTLAPFTGPEDGAKAQEYQDPSSGVIGVIDVRGSNRAYYMSLFGENLGRDDQYIFARGGGYDVFKVGFYSDRMPHNLSFNALTPLNWPGSSLQPAPAGAYPPATNPATWNNFEYGLQRNTIGGNVEVNARSPFFFRVDYNEVQTTGIRPSSGQLGTGSGNGLIEFGLPTDYTTKNSVLEGGYKGRNWNVKLGFLDSKFSSNSGDTAQWGNFFMRSALDTSLQPQDSELKKWTLNFSMRDLWLDSTLLVRLTQSELTSDFGVVAGGLKPTGNQAPPTGVGYLVTAPSSSTFYGEHKTTTATFSLQSTPMTGLGTRLYYEYYDKQNDSTQINYAAGGLRNGRENCPNPGTGIQSSTQPGSASRRTMLPNPSSTRRTCTGSTRTTASAGTASCWAASSSSTSTARSTPAPQTEDLRLWAEWRASMGDTLSGRLKYQFLQRESELDPTHTNNASGVLPTTVPYYFRAYDVGNFDQNMVKFNVDWNPMALLTIGFGATWRQTDYKDFYFGRNEDTTQNYDLTVSYGNADKFLLTGIANWGETKFDQSYRNIASRSEPDPRRHADGDDVRLGHPQFPGELAVRGAGRLDGDRQAEADRLGQLVRNQRRRGLLVGQLCRRRRLQRRPAGQLHHRQHQDRAVPDQGRIPHQQELERHGRLRVREVRLRRRPDARLRQLLPVLPEPGRHEQHLEQRRVHQPQLQEQHLLHHGQVQLRHAADPGAVDGPGSGPGSGRDARAAARRRPRPLRRPRRRCRRSRWTRRCCSTSTRRC